MSVKFHKIPFNWFKQAKKQQGEEREIEQISNAILQYLSLGSDPKPFEVIEFPLISVGLDQISTMLTPELQRL